MYIMSHQTSHCETWEGFSLHHFVYDKNGACKSEHLGRIGPIWIVGRRHYFDVSHTANDSSLVIYYILGCSWVISTARYPFLATWTGMPEGLWMLNLGRNLQCSINGLQCNNVCVSICLQTTYFITTLCYQFTWDCCSDIALSVNVRYRYI